MKITRFSFLLTLSFLSLVVIFVRTGGVKSYQQSYYPVSPKGPIPPDNSPIKVVRVVDGDTIEVSGGWKVRYIGINAPESVAPSRPVQCFGHESSSRNKELVQGQTVTLIKDISQKDEYGRLLRYVYKGDMFVNLELVKEGFARTDTFPPDILYEEKFKEAQTFAQRNHLGLWSEVCSKL